MLAGSVEWKSAMAHYRRLLKQLVDDRLNMRLIVEVMELADELGILME